jgi:integrase
LGEKLRIGAAITRGAKGRQHYGQPKSFAGHRVIDLDGPAVDLLAEHLARRGLTGADSDAYVFANSRGGPLGYSAWRQRVWLPACKAAGHDGATFHDLRRANATALVAAGVDVKTAQRRLGHADVRTTLQVYAEATRDNERAAAAALSGTFLRKPRDNRGMDRNARTRGTGKKAR